MVATLEAVAVDGALSSMLRRIVELRKSLDAKAEEAKPLSAELQQLESLAVEQMGLHGYKTLRVDGGIFTTKHDLYCNVLAERREALIEVAAQLGIENVVTVQTGTIKAYIKEQLKAIGDDLDADTEEGVEQADVAQRLAAIMPELALLVSVYEKTTLVFRKR